MKNSMSKEVIRINGNVTKVQKGQQGPVITIGVPSSSSNKLNIPPMRLAQQQKQLLKSSVVPVHFKLFCWIFSHFSAISRSHLVDTAYCFLLLLTGLATLKTLLLSLLLLFLASVFSLSFSITSDSTLYSNIF